MQINMLSFGQIATITGAEWILETDVSDVSSLQIVLKDRYPELQKLNYRLAINHEIITENVPVLIGATVALLPPFSGG